MRRHLFGAVLAALAAAPLLAGPATAAGTAGVELLPRAADGRPSTAFHVDFAGRSTADLAFELRNLNATPVAIRVYAASAARSAAGSFAIAGANTATWIGVRDEVIHLRPREVRSVRATVQRAGAAPHGAIVLESTSGAVIRRVATVVYAEGGAPATSGPARLWLLALVPTALAAAVLLRRSRRRPSLSRAWRRPT